MESSLSNSKKAASVTLIQRRNERLTVAAPFRGVQQIEKVVKRCRKNIMRLTEKEGKSAISQSESDLFSKQQEG